MQVLQKTWPQGSKTGLFTIPNPIGHKSASKS